MENIPVQFNWKQKPHLYYGISGMKLSHIIPCPHSKLRALARWMVHDKTKKLRDKTSHILALIEQFKLATWVNMKPKVKNVPHNAPTLIPFMSLLIYKEIRPNASRITLGLQRLAVTSFSHLNVNPTQDFWINPSQCWVTYTNRSYFAFEKQIFWNFSLD